MNQIYYCPSYHISSGSAHTRNLTVTAVNLGALLKFCKTVENKVKRICIIRAVKPLVKKTGNPLKGFKTLAICIYSYMKEHTTNFQSVVKYIHI